jgi:hypothetical protein
MRKCEICGYHLDMHSELCERMQKEIARAEKAEAKLKASEESRKNAVLCMMESNRLANEDQARAEKAEAERDELKKLSSHGNGEILLGWMDAHRKAMDRIKALETALAELFYNPYPSASAKAESENAQLKTWLDAVTDFAYYDNEHEEAICKYIAWRNGSKNKQLKDEK